MRVQRADERYAGQGPGWTGRYCFSYDGHYDAGNVSFGRLLACNEFVLEPGAGFGLHRHAGVDIVTVVIEGSLTHVGADSGRLAAGQSRLLRTEGGIEHDERNDGTAPVRFVQAFLLPGAADPLPLTPPDGATLRPGDFVLVTRGDVGVGDVELSVGDSVRLDVPAGLRLPAAAEVLVWSTA